MTTTMLEVAAETAPPTEERFRVGDLKAGAFTEAKRSFTNPTDVIEILNYIDFLAQNSSTSADDLELPFPKGKDKQEWKLTRTEVNKLFFGHLDKRADEIKKNVKLPDEKAMKALGESMKARQAQALASLKANVATYLRDADRNMAAVTSCLINARATQEEIENMTGADPTERVKGICEGLANVNWNFLSFDGIALSFVSRADVILRHIDDKAGLHYELNCGKFKATFDINSMRIKVTPYERCATGYIHPHINRGGDVCFGNGADAYGKATASGKFLDVLKLLDNMLPHYNSSSPYILIHDFKSTLLDRDERERKAHEQKEKAKAKGIPEGLEDQEILDDDPDFIDDSEWSNTDE